MIQVPVTGLNIPENGAATCYGTKPFGLDTCIDNTADSCTWVFPTPTCTEPPNDGSGSTPTLFPSSSPSLETTSDPCGDLFEFESTFLALLTVEPCSLGETVLERFLDELIAEYNKAQFELCDPSFRRMTRYEILNSCSNDDSNNHRDRRRLYARANPRLAYRVGGTSTAESTSYTHGNGRRRRLEKVESNQEKRLSVSSLLKKDEDETFLDVNDMEEESTNQSALTSDDSSCSCSPFPTDPRSITEQEFEELANQVVQRVTGGEVEVVEQFEVDEGCPEERPEDRVALRGGLVAYLNVDVNSLTVEAINELERVCVLGYNNWVIENCAEQYTQIRSCSIFTFYLERNPDRCPSENNGLGFDIRGDSGSPLDLIFSEDKPHKRKYNPTRSLQSASNTTNSWNFVASGDRTHKLDDDTIDTLPSDLCFCRRGVATGRNPTLHEFAEILNETGIIDFVIEAEREEETACQRPRVFSQFIYVMANGNLGNEAVRDQLVQFLQDTLNTLSVVECVSNHFYVYSIDLVWYGRYHASRRHGDTWALQFVARFISYGAKPRVGLYKPKKHGRKKHDRKKHGTKKHGTKKHGHRKLEQSDTDDNLPEGYTDIQSLDLDERELQRLTTESACFCSPNTPETRYLLLKDINRRLDEGICDEAVPGVTSLWIVR